MRQGFVARFDFRDAMAKHHYVISGLETEANGFVQSILDQNRAHVEIVSHNQAVESKFVAQQLCNNPARHGSRRGLRLEARIPAVANHHAVYMVGTARYAVRTPAGRPYHDCRKTASSFRSSSSRVRSIRGN